MNKLEREPRKKTIYYKDELNDDFALTRDLISAKKIGEDYQYEHNFLLWKMGSWFIYRAIATPVVWVYCKAVYGLRVKNRKAILRLRGGCFLYGNHTQSVIDAFLPTVAAFPKRCDIITAEDAVSVPVIRHVVPMLGGLPLPDTLVGMKNFQAVLQKRTEKGRVEAVYPEAHVWPYYNKIRPFGDCAFSYPCKYGRPAVPFTVTYRKRKILRRLPPAVTVVIGEPVYPDETLSMRRAREKMRDQVYEQMCRAAKNSYEYIRYVKTEEKEEA